MNKTTPYNKPTYTIQIGDIMSTNDNSSTNQLQSAMRISHVYNKTPNTSPSEDTINNRSTGETMQTSDTATDTPPSSILCMEKERKNGLGHIENHIFGKVRYVAILNYYSLWEDYVREIAKAGLPTFIDW